MWCGTNLLYKYDKINCHKPNTPTFNTDATRIQRYLSGETGVKDQTITGWKLENPCEKLVLLWQQNKTPRKKTILEGGIFENINPGVPTFCFKPKQFKSKKQLMLALIDNLPSILKKVKFGSRKLYNEFEIMLSKNDSQKFYGYYFKLE